MIVALFDIDGTLLNTGGAGQAAMEAALADVFGIHMQPHGIPTAGRTDRAITEDLFAYFGIPDTRENRRRFVDAYIHRLQDALRRRQGCVLPGVRELLDRLSTSGGVLLGLLTGNYERGAWSKLRHFQLDGHFKFGAFGDHHRERDDVARDAIRRLRDGLGGGETWKTVWVIGDTPADVRCGRAIGARTLAVNTGIFPRSDVHAAGPDVVFDDLSDYQRVADAILDG